MRPRIINQEHENTILQYLSVLLRNEQILW